LTVNSQSGLPERIIAADPAQLARIGKLVKGVKAD